MSSKIIFATLSLLLSVTSNAASQQLCLLTKSHSPDFDAIFINAIFLEVNNGNIDFNGKLCNGNGSKDFCNDPTPISGAGVLYSNKMIGTFEGSDFEIEGPFSGFSRTSLQVILDLDTLDGAYYAGATINQDNGKPITPIIDSGIVSSVPCPPTSKEIKILERKFRRRVKIINNKN